MTTALAPVLPLVPLMPLPRNSNRIHSSKLYLGVSSLSSVRYSWKCFPQLPCRSSRGLSTIPATPSPFVRKTLDDITQSISNIPKPHIYPLPLKASKKEPPFCYPEMTEKPKWWWRTLSSLPYLMPLHQIIVYGASTYHLHPFFDNHEYLAYPFFDATVRLPNWLWMLYFSAAYLGVVRRKECPHFFRFHLLMGMLLESFLQVIGIGTGWLPLHAYYGKVAIPVLAAVAFAYLFTVLESIKCVLVGMYADIPFFSDAAYIHTTTT